MTALQFRFSSGSYEHTLSNRVDKLLEFLIPHPAKKLATPHGSSLKRVTPDSNMNKMFYATSN